MISVEFRGVLPGTCSWCRKEKNEVFLVVMSSRAGRGPQQRCLNCLRNEVRSELDGPRENTANTSCPSADDGNPGIGPS